MSNRIEHVETYREAMKALRVANRAVREVQAESHRLNVPNVYSRNKQLYYDMPRSRVV